MKVRIKKFVSGQTLRVQNGPLHRQESHETGETDMDMMGLVEDNERVTPTKHLTSNKTGHKTIMNYETDGDELSIHHGNGPGSIDRLRLNKDRVADLVAHLKKYHPEHF